MGRMIGNINQSCNQAGRGVVTFQTVTWSAGSYIVRVESCGLSRQLMVKHLK